MGWKILCLLTVLASSLQAFDHTHKTWTEALTQYRDAKGRVYYPKLRADLAHDPKHPLTRYLAELKTVSAKEFDQWSRSQQMAFLINAYNALTWRLLNDHPPVKSIKSLGGVFTTPWDLNFFSLLDGRITTLNQIEHEQLRAKYKEPRIHMALNCASVSCPGLPPTAFSSDTLETQLQTATKDFFADPKTNYYDKKTNVLYLSKILDWFADDFESYGGVLKTVEKFGPESLVKPLARSPRVKYIPYNWDLNQADLPRDTADDTPPTELLTILK